MREKIVKKPFWEGYWGVGEAKKTAEKKERQGC